MLVHVRRLGRVLRVRAVPLPQAARNPTASYAGAKGKFAKVHSRSPSRSSEVVLLVFYAIPAWATRVAAFAGGERSGRRSRRRASSSRGTSTIRDPDGKFGRTDIKLVAADNPIGLDRTGS